MSIPSPKTRAIEKSPFELQELKEAVFFMQTDGSVSKLPSDATSRWWLGLRSCLIFILGAIVFCAIAIAAPKGAGTPAQAKDAAPSEFAGSDTCATCHEEVAKGFASNPHIKMAQMHGKSGVTCENCHGAGKAHADSADPSKISNPAKSSAKEVDAACLSCHHGQHSNFERSAHGEANVSCVSCHSIHGGKDPEQLLKAEQPVLCFQCHTDAKPQFSLPFHHKVDEGLVKCSDCHDPHGTFGRKGLKSVSQQDAVCMKCHAETAGPFVYEHAVVKTEGCVSCHSPHGSPNPRLLNRANVNTICLECHSPSQNFSTSEPIGPAHNQAVQYQACTICHTDIHGSNVSPVFFNTK
jgi:DmsE family decaheme c-type cytochrome